MSRTTTILPRSARHRAYEQMLTIRMFETIMEDESRPDGCPELSQFRRPGSVAVGLARVSRTTT